MGLLDRATVIPKDSADVNQLTSLLDTHTWLRHVDFTQNFKVGQLSYFFLNVDRLHKAWSGEPMGGDKQLTVNEIATQLSLWSTQIRYNNR